MYLPVRPRRNRKSPNIRRMVRENSLSTDDLILPLFVMEGNDTQEEISSMPGCFRRTPDLLVKYLKEINGLDIPAVALFPVVDDSLKTSDAKESFNPEGLIPETLKRIKDSLPDLILITDIALDPYNSDGHDGLVTQGGRILNDETVEVLCKMAVTQAEAGSDIVAPSDMMDGRIGAIRDALDENSFTDVSIMSYAAKYASAFYGPFRDALDSAPKAGDKKTYQMDYGNSMEAIKEVELDITEGADFVMVKPALSYLDVIKSIRENFTAPVAAYNVSGEYAMLHAAAEKGWLDLEKTMMESLVSIKRAGADIILTYFAEEAARLVQG